MKRGIFVVVLGPTGSGKSSLLKHVHEVYPEIVFPTSCTTRIMRAGEVDGDHYHFLSETEFKKRVDEGAFLEWAEYGGNYYGTPKAQITDAVSEGKIAISDIEVQGVRQVKAMFPAESFKVVYVDGGSWDELEKRIRARAPLTDAELLKRRKRYEDEVTYKPESDFVVENHNGKFEEAKTNLDRIIETLKKQIAEA